MDISQAIAITPLQTRCDPNELLSSQDSTVCNLQPILWLGEEVYFKVLQLLDQVKSFNNLHSTLLISVSKSCNLTAARHSPLLPKLAGRGKNSVCIGAYAIVQLPSLVCQCSWTLLSRCTATRRSCASSSTLVLTYLMPHASGLSREEHHLPKDDMLAVKPVGRLAARRNEELHKHICQQSRMVEACQCTFLSYT